MNTFSLLQTPYETKTEIAVRCRKRRKEKKLSQAQLSQRADVSLGSLKRFEQTGEISLTSLIKIGFALGCQDDFNALFARKGYATIQEVIDEQS